ncbi:hypothetical protein IFM89_006724 [Coptis chinensis]|uniref:Uncharacterized protein n=1 Tax=Coptis chinensis TaxID=261450 RepID=A0A835HU35_9MAGN|nr:hypothetical protein IFM89_006724 [Coptis chinensis]
MQECNCSTIGRGKNFFGTSRFYFDCIDNIDTKERSHPHVPLASPKECLRAHDTFAGFKPMREDLTKCEPRKRSPLCRGMLHFLPHVYTGLKVISANRCLGLEQTQQEFEVADLRESINDPLSQDRNTALKKDHGIEGGIPVVFSLKKPKVKLLPFKGSTSDEENPSDYQVNTLCLH